MGLLSAKEFFDQLKTDSLKSSFVLKGTAKKSDKDNEVLFAKEGDLGNWVTIPSNVIESVEMLNTFSKEGELFFNVKLYLNATTSDEELLFRKLFSSTECEGTHISKCEWKNKMLDSVV